MIPIIKLLRPQHYIKNLFIFAPALFAFSFSFETIVNEILAFIFFSLTASAVYIFNDLQDVEEDRLHPQKKFRPLASGEVSMATAWILIVSLLAFSLPGSFLINRELLFVLFVYLVMNIFYSIKLKHIAIVDISIIAIGFVLRLYAGSTATGIPLSAWIVTITYLLSLFIALAKRRDDVLLASMGKRTRKNIDGYNLEFINIGMSVMAGIVVVSYILYTVSAEVMERMHTHYLYVTTVFVIMGIFRYLQLTFVYEKSGNPTQLVLNDPFLRITIVMWLIAYMVIVLV